MSKVQEPMGVHCQKEGTNMNQKAIDALRVLGIDAIEKSKSGHPGIVMGAAPMAATLWTQVLEVSPSRPTWFNRDRFVLSAGHGSMLLYGLLHLSGFDVTMDDIKSFRQLDSRTPGHPEYKFTAGVDATTGPLGQGIAMAVGMALAEKKLAATYNTENYKIVDHYTYALCGDGDLMEGVSTEAASFAGLQKLSKLIVMYDSNDINLDGPTSESFTEDIQKKFQALGWQTLYVEDGTDTTTILAALEAAKAETERPTLIEIKTVIGCGSINEGTSKVHGAPLGAEDAAATRAKYGWTSAPFEIDAAIYDYFKVNVQERGEKAYAEWANTFNDYAKVNPEMALQLQQSIKKNYDNVEWQTYETGFEQATRNSSHDSIQTIAAQVPSLFGGSADLAGSNMTAIKDEGLFSDNNLASRNIQYGVREFAMAGIANGMSLHGGLLPFVSTFMVFSDYLKPAMRLSALMEQQVIYVLTHDSIAVGEDGPTHEPVEQLAMIRSIPNTFTFRPADARETVGSWYAGLSIKNAPTAIVLTRQNLPVLPGTDSNQVTRGGYIVQKESHALQLILLAAGSEVSLVSEVATKLEAEGVGVRVVSMPSIELFNLQSAEYRAEVLPNTPGVKRLAVEMAHPQPWYQFLNLTDEVMGITTFGASGPAADVLAKFGFTTEHVLAKAKALLAK